MLYIANWKMQLSFAQEYKLAQEYLTLAPLVEQKDAQLVLCPSFPSLENVGKTIQDSPSLKLGAQDCSGHASGPFTGQVSAQSLAQVGCSYCIVGHSERRDFETDEQIADKVKQLRTNTIIPVICVGETEEEYKKNLTQHAIEKQLNHVCKVLQESGNSTPVCIAYEPVWSIGTEIIPDSSHITKSFNSIQKLTQQYSLDVPITLLYGGSVNGQTIAGLLVTELAGFLIGSASLDIQKLKKIVSWK